MPYAYTKEQVLRAIEGSYGIIFESYCWQEGKQGLRDEPTKENDHAMDALRYAITGIADGPSISIEDY